MSDSRWKKGENGLWVSHDPIARKRREKQSIKDRLTACEQRLREAGVVDVKFFWRNNGCSLSKIKSDVADILEAMLDGRYTPAPKFGDSVRGFTEIEPLY